MIKLELIRKKYRRADLAVPLAIMAALLAVIFVVTQLLGRAQMLEIKEPLYQYVFESADEYPEGILMKKTEDSLLIDNGIQTYDTNGYPFYYRDSDALVLTDTFLYLDRNGDIGGKAEYFNILSKNGDKYSLSEEADVVIGGGMLHDGGDVFIFLEDTAVSYNGKQKNIRGLSYVVCFQGESILIASYGEGAVYEELDGQEALATMENGVKIDLRNDVYYKANGTKHLLFSDPEIFDTISATRKAVTGDE